MRGGIDEHSVLGSWYLLSVDALVFSVVLLETEDSRSILYTSEFPRYDMSLLLRWGLIYRLRRNYTVLSD